MTPSFDQDLRQRLAALELRGRQYLRVAHRREAVDRALAWALPITVAVPALWLLSSAWLRGNGLVLSLIAVLVPLLAAGVVYAVTRSRQRIGRDEALGVLDQRHGLKDRLTASAALLDAPRRDGFAQAALLEAQPWVDLAMAQPLAAPARPWSEALRRRWLFLPAALLMAVIAGWMQGRSGAALPSTNPIAAVALRGDDTRADVPMPTNASAPQTARSAASPRQDVATGPGAAATPTPDPRAQTPSTAAAPGGPGATAAPASSTTSPPSHQRPGASVAAMAAATSADSAPQAPGTSRSPSRPAEASPPQPQQRSAATAPGAGQDDSADQESAAEARSQGQQEAPSQRGSQPPPAEKSSQSSKDGKPSDSRSKGGNDGQNDGKGSGEGQNNGQRKGEDSGPKSGRGFATLMLARPMRDQVQGQTNPGPVTSALQQGRPQGGPAASAQAQDRGRLADDAAVLPAPPRTAADRALLRDYFARDAAASGAAPAASVARNDSGATR